LWRQTSPVAGVITSISPRNFHQRSDAIFSTSFAHALRNRFSIYFDSGFAVRREISQNHFAAYCDVADRVLLELMHRGDDLCHQIGTCGMAAWLKKFTTNGDCHAR
jgi:hypothetical protein